MNKKDDELFQEILKRGLLAKPGNTDIDNSFKEAQERRDQLFRKQDTNNPDYGYSLQNPIMCSSVGSSYVYLSRLRTADGLKLTWERIGSVCLVSLHDVDTVMVDKYQLLLDNENYRKIFICPYGHDGNYAPKGMYLAQDGNDQNNNKSEKTEDSGNGTHITETEPEDAVSATQDKNDRDRSGPFITCYYCHAAIRKNAKYCRLCGAPNIFTNIYIARKELNNQFTSSEKKIYFYARKPVIFFAVIAALAGIIYYESFNSHKQENIKVNNATNKIVSSSETEKTKVAEKKSEEDQKKEIVIAEYSDQEKKTITQITAYPVGSIVKYGTYEQDNDDNEAEPIEWIVLQSDAENGYIQIITKNVIDSIKYAEKENAKWSNSRVREWLNNNFIYTAFSDVERKYLITTEIKGDEGDKNTTDKVFLLNYERIEKFFPSDNKYRIGTATEYLKSLHMLTVSENNACSWGTREPKVKVDSKGKKTKTFATAAVGIRPSVFIRIDKGVPVIKE